MPDFSPLGSTQNGGGKPSVVVDANRYNASRYRKTYDELHGWAVEDIRAGAALAAWDRYQELVEFRRLHALEAAPFHADVALYLKALVDDLYRKMSRLGWMVRDGLHPKFTAPVASSGEIRKRFPLKDVMRRYGRLLLLPLDALDRTRPRSESVTTKPLGAAAAPSSVTLPQNDEDGKPPFVLEVRGYRLQVFAGCTKIKAVIAAQNRKGNKSKRGKISVYSRKSRKNFLDKIASLRFEDVKKRSNPDGRAYFGTLTYHLNYGKDWHVWKRQMDTWLKRVRRKYPTSSGFWFLEFQERGAPHYHYCIFGVRDGLDTFRAWAGAAWNAIVDPENGSHLMVATHEKSCAIVQNQRHATHYVAKYSSKNYQKTDEELKGCGRWWAFFGGENMDFSPSLEVSLSIEDLNSYARLVSQWSLEHNGHYIPKKCGRLLSGSSPGGFTVYALGDVQEDDTGDDLGYELRPLAYQIINNSRRLSRGQPLDGLPLPDQDGVLY